MAVPVVNIQVEQGTDFTAAFNITNPDGSALNLTNRSLSAKMRKWSGSAGYIGFGATYGAYPTAGEISITLTDTQTGIITAGRYNYDVIVTNDVSGKKEKVISGQAIVNPTVS